ncbi:hypothetical protein CRUP_025428 [Coryphaenoides rupestris]|nr:hypothetical protein CRUP_025428 [Coryphaenoides rupestris]
MVRLEACQQDAQEFLRFLLDGLHNEVNRLSYVFRDEEKGKKMWSKYLAREDSKIVDLKRFSEARRTSKLSTFVNFPMKDLDLREFASEHSTNAVYNLYAVSNHSGTTMGGHYTAYCRNPASGEWYTFNDSRVTPMSSSQAKHLSMVNSSYCNSQSTECSTAVVLREVIPGPARWATIHPPLLSSGRGSSTAADVTLDLQPSVSNATPAAPPELSMSGVVLVLLGGRQSGKTRAGNIILGTSTFQEGRSTTHSSCRTTSVLGRQVTVVDTPGWPIVPGDASSNNFLREICQGLALCQRNPHAFLLVLPVTSSFGYQEWQAMEAHLWPLHATIWPRAMVLFTHADKLGALTIQEYLERQPGLMQLLLWRCGFGYHILDRRSSFPLEAQVQELLLHVDNMSGVNPRPTWEMKQGTHCWLRVGERRKQEVMMRNLGRQGVEEVMEIRAMPRVLTSLKPDISLILLGRRRSGKSSAGNTILGTTEFQNGKKTAIKSKVWFLLTIPVDFFKEEDRRAIEENLAVLGSAVWRQTAVLFTYGCELKERAVQEYISQKGEPLRWVLDRCSHRHCVFDNNKSDDTQVSRLLEMVERW